MQLESSLSKEGLKGVREAKLLLIKGGIKREPWFPLEGLKGVREASLL